MHTKTSSQIRLDFISNYCNAWPEIKIEINGTLYWHGFIEEKITLDFEFDLLETNNVTISYLNKRKGPDIYDTVVIDDKIIEDQNCILTDVYLNRARCTWMAESSIMYYLDGTTFPNRGFMDQKGSIILSFPSDVYGWIVEQRKLLFPQTGKKSDIDYKNIYIPANENLKIKETIEKVRVLLQNIND
jgi:hypothetical protein